MTKLLCSIIFVFCSFILQAQKTELIISYLDKFNEAADLFQKQKYAHAIALYDELLLDSQLPAELKEQSSFYSAWSSLELYQKNSDQKARQFLFDYPHSILKNKLMLRLSDFYYMKHHWLEAQQAILAADLTSLSETERIEYTFKLGYSYFMQKQLKKASNCFFQLLNHPSDYQASATYYYAHIAYEQSDYPVALDNFKKIENHPKFSSLAPYYISHIFYYQQKYSELIEYLENKVDTLVPERKQEVYRMLGESYYNIQEYKRAVPYFKELKTASREEKYHLAYALYKSGEYTQASEAFKESIVDGDSLDQIIYYHLAECYLKTNQNKFAFQAFLKAHEISADTQLQEDALFSLAKLSFQSSLDPYDEANQYLKEFIKKYPNSPRVSEAYQYLLNIFLMTNNYSMAIGEMEKLSMVSPSFQEAYQRACYNYALTFFQQRQWSQTIENLQKSQKYKTQKEIYALSFYWLAETYYQQKDYLKASTFYQEFKYKAGAIMLNELSLANYNLGYCFFHLKDYAKSLTFFRSFVENKEVTDSIKLSDALIKMADIHYINKDFNTSMSFYQRALSESIYRTDYVSFQKAILYGLLGDQLNKKSTLQAFVKNFDYSTYIPEAKINLARIYAADNQPSDALKLYDQMISFYPNTSVFQKAMIEKAQLLFNLNQNDQALEAYKSYIAQFPNYQDAQVALQQVKKIYSESNKLQDYTQYVSSLGFVNITASSLDSTAYETAYFQYVESNQEQAIKGFSDYLSEVDKKIYPGIFSTQAHFYRAESFYSKNQYLKALSDYEFVISKPFSIYSEKSLVKATRILWNEKQYANALKYYVTLEQTAQFKENVLEALQGQMRSHFKLTNFDGASHVAEKMISTQEISEQDLIEAKYIAGKSYQELGKNEKALMYYQQIIQSKGSVYYSEVMYQLAYLQFQSNQHTQAESTLQELLNAETLNKHYMARGLMLWSDVYVAKNDLFQAKQTLLTVIENHDEPALIDIAREKLNAVLQLEEKIKKQAELDQIKQSTNVPSNEEESIFSEDEN